MVHGMQDGMRDILGIQSRGILFMFRREFFHIKWA